MARSFNRKQHFGTLSEINVTPLIDLAFSLLIIFMITTPLLEQTISVNLPTQSQNLDDVRKEDKFQAIGRDSSGKIFWGEQPVTLDELDQRLEGLAQDANPPVLAIRADGSLAYQQVMDIVDLVRKHNLSRISFDTQVR